MRRDSLPRDLPPLSAIQLACEDWSQVKGQKTADVACKLGTCQSTDKSLCEICPVRSDCASPGHLFCVWVGRQRAKRADRLRLRQRGRSGQVSEELHPTLQMTRVLFDLGPGELHH